MGRTQSYQGAATIPSQHQGSVALPREHLQSTPERARRHDEWGLEALEQRLEQEKGSREGSLSLESA